MAMWDYSMTFESFIKLIKISTKLKTKSFIEKGHISYIRQVVRSSEEVYTPSRPGMGF